ncbi:MAG: glutaredoxin family protein [Candidatus Binatia bacterium]
MRLTFITRRDCHLCEDMAVVIEAAARDWGFELNVQDVDTDPDLCARYGMEVPVLLVNGRKAFKYRVSREALERRLRAEGRRARWRGLLGRPAT